MKLRGNSLLIDKRIIILAIFLTAVVILILISIKYSRRELSPKANSTPTISLRQPSISRGNSIGPEASKSSLLRRVTSTSSNVEKSSLQQFLMNNLRNSATIFIGKNCIAFPTVINISNTTTLKISNEDEKSHTLNFETGKTYDLQSRSISNIPISAFPKQKLIWYNCDQNSELSGYIYIP